jgi:hypothetical protein
MGLGRLIDQYAGHVNRSKNLLALRRSPSAKENTLSLGIEGQRWYPDRNTSTARYWVCLAVIVIVIVIADRVDDALFRSCAIAALTN